MKIEIENVKNNNKRDFLCSVMQSDEKNFGGYVVLESVNIVSRGEDSILQQIYAKQIFFDLFLEDFSCKKKIISKVIMHFHKM